MRNCFQYSLVGHSETSNDQAFLNPFDHYIKMKAYMRVEVGGGPLPQGRLSPSINYVHRDERDMRNCFQHPLEGHSETINNQALLLPFIIT